MKGLRRLIAGLLFVLAAAPASAGQAANPNSGFVRALGQFSLGLEGAYGDEGRSVRSSLDAMQRGLEQWDAAIRTAEAAIESESGRAEPNTAARMHAALGGAYLDRGRVADALREFNAANQLDPSGADMHTVEGLVYREFGNDRDAATVRFQTAARLDPRNPVRWYVLARHLLQIGKPDEARGAFQTLQTSWEDRAVGKGRTAVEAPFIQLNLVLERSRVEPFFPPVVYAGGFSLLRRGEFEKAIAAFRDAASRDPLAARPVERMEAMGQAATAFGDGSVETAIRHLEVAIELEPDRAEAHRILGRAYLAADRLDEAARALGTAVRLSPGDERTHLTFADALIQMRRYPEAEQALRQTIEAFPGSGRAHYALGRLHQRQGHYEEALAELGATVTFHPLIGLNGIYQTIGAINAARQNFDAAVDAYEKRVGVHPNDADAHQDLGDTYSRLGRHDEALAEFAVVSTLATGRTDAFAAMAQVHLKDGRYEDAALAARRALALDGAYAPARYALGTSLMRLGRTDEGQKEIEEFQRLQTEVAAAHARELELGGLRREASESSANGDHMKAVSLLRKALLLEPDAAVSHLNLGLALLYAGQTAEAIDRFKSAVTLDGPSEVHQHLAQAYLALGQIEESGRELAIYEQMRQESLRRAGAGR